MTWSGIEKFHRGHQPLIRRLGWGKSDVFRVKRLVSTVLELDQRNHEAGGEVMVWSTRPLGLSRGCLTSEASEPWRRSTEVNQGQTWLR